MTQKGVTSWCCFQQKLFEHFTIFRGENTAPPWSSSASVENMVSFSCSLDIQPWSQMFISHTHKNQSPYVNSLSLQNNLASLFKYAFYNLTSHSKQFINISLATQQNTCPYMTSDVLERLIDQHSVSSLSSQFLKPIQLSPLVWDQKK